MYMCKKKNRDERNLRLPGTLTVRLSNERSERGLDTFELISSAPIKSRGRRASASTIDTSSESVREIGFNTKPKASSLSRSNSRIEKGRFLYKMIIVQKLDCCLKLRRNKYHAAFSLISIWRTYVVLFSISDSASSEQYNLSRTLKSSALLPSTFNVAAKADIYVNATCGEKGPETFCKPSESSKCAVCDSKSSDPNKRHDIGNVLDPSSGRWWQSPTLAKGDVYEYVTILLDLKQVSASFLSMK